MNPTLLLRSAQILALMCVILFLPLSYADEDEKEHLFTQWGAMWHRPAGNDGSVRINVSCGDRVHFQMGNVSRYEINETFIITDYTSSRIID